MFCTLQLFCYSSSSVTRIYYCFLIFFLFDAFLGFKFFFGFFVFFGFFFGISLFCTFENLLGSDKNKDAMLLNAFNLSSWLKGSEVFMLMTRLYSGIINANVH